MFELLAAIILIGFFSGCASISTPWESFVPIDRFEAYKEPDGAQVLPVSVDEDIPDANILSVTSDMASALDEAINHVRNPRERLEALAAFLVQSVRYDTVVDGYGAKTARETFEAGAGNCLSYSNLFVAMARHAGMDAKFQEIPTPPNWERDGEILFSTRHIGASVDIKEPMDRRILVETSGTEWALPLDDFSTYYFVPTLLSPTSTGVNLPFVRMISDQRAFAQYYNNLGSRQLADGNASDAFRFFIKALKTDPKLGFAWSNLGVVYSRNGQYEAARKAFLRGMNAAEGARDVTTLSIANNMVELYKRSGDEEKVAFYRSQVAAFRKKNPYYQYTVAKKAFDDKQYERSVRHFKTAIRLKNDEHIFHYGLALAYYKLGNIKKAEKYIKKAKFHAYDEGDKSFYDGVRDDLKRGDMN